MTAYGLSLLAAVLLAVYPTGSQGFAGAIVVAFVVLGGLILLTMWVSSKPKRRRRR